MNFKNDYVQCTINPVNEKLQIHGTVVNPSAYTRVIVIAPNPIDRMTTYAGSGLPMPCPNMAFDNTRNKAVVDASGGFNITFDYPSSYYTDDQLKRIPPSVFFIFQRQQGVDPTFIRIPLEDILPLRTLTYRPGFRAGPEFYAKKDTLIPPMTAEGVMRTMKTYKAKYDIA
jgi:hypothetical protein